MVSRAVACLIFLLLLIPGACAVQNAPNNSVDVQDAGVCTVCMQHRQQPTPTPEPVSAEIVENNASAARLQEHQWLQNRVRAVIAAQQNEQAQELRNMSAVGQEVYRNQNTVRLAVHTFLSLEELHGGIGGTISAVARAMNNSVQVTAPAEERILERKGYIRFFIGGDEVAAGILAEEVPANRERIREMNRLIGECDCDEETRNMLREQLQNMEQEMNRLGALARNETENKGLLGWLWK
jgi:hypothetical protein